MWPEPLNDGSGYEIDQDTDNQYRADFCIPVTFYEELLFLDFVILYFKLNPNPNPYSKPNLNHNPNPNPFPNPNPNPNPKSLKIVTLPKS